MDDRTPHDTRLPRDGGQHPSNDDRAPPVAYVGLGSNLGDRLGHLRSAVLALARSVAVAPGSACRVASLYESAPLGGPSPQGPYLNSVVELAAAIDPQRLLAALLAVEFELGRTRRERWEARVIDLDLLLFGDRILDGPGLTVPHPRLHERRFVLEPLSELAGERIHPLLGDALHSHRDRLRTSETAASIRRIADPRWVGSDLGEPPRLRKKLDSMVPAG